MKNNIYSLVLIYFFLLTLFIPLEFEWKLNNIQTVSYDLFLRVYNLKWKNLLRTFKTFGWNWSGKRSWLKNTMSVCRCGWTFFSVPTLFQHHRHQLQSIQALYRHLTNPHPKVFSIIFFLPGDQWFWNGI